MSTSQAVLKLAKLGSGKKTEVARLDVAVMAEPTICGSIPAPLFNDVAAYCLEFGRRRPTRRLTPMSFTRDCFPRYLVSKGRAVDKFGYWIILCLLRFAREVHERGY